MNTEGTDNRATATSMAANVRVLQAALALALPVSINRRNARVADGTGRVAR